MKKIALIVTFGLMVSAGAFAASTVTGTLTLTGYVAKSVTITVNPAAVASNLALDTTASDLAIGSIDMTTNDFNGLFVTVSGSGTFTNPSNGDTLTYTIATSPNSGAGPYTTADLTGATPILTTSTKTTGTPVSLYLYINYTGDPTLTSGVTYSDTLTFTVTAN